MKDYYTKEYDADEAKKYSNYSIEELNNMIAQDLIECGLCSNIEEAYKKIAEVDNSK